MIAGLAIGEGALTLTRFAVEESSESGLTGLWDFQDLGLRCEWADSCNRGASGRRAVVGGGQHGQECPCHREESGYACGWCRWLALRFGWFRSRDGGCVGNGKGGATTRVGPRPARCHPPRALRGLWVPAFAGTTVMGLGFPLSRERRRRIPGLFALQPGFPRARERRLSNGRCFAGTTVE